MMQQKYMLKLQNGYMERRKYKHYWTKFFNYSLLVFIFHDGKFIPKKFKEMLLNAKERKFIKLEIWKVIGY